MMATAEENIVLEVTGRDETGKNANRRLRATGVIPGIVYGLDRDPFKVAVDPARIEAVLRLKSGANTIFSLELKGEDKRRDAMIKELQRDPVSERAVHVDFVRVDLTKAVQVRVPVVLVGIAEGVKTDGGVMDFVLREVLVECLPGNIPEHLDVDISALHINQHVSLSDVTIGEGVKVLDELDQIVAGVSAPRAEEEKPEEVDELEGEEAAEGDEAKDEEASKSSDDSSE
jgi:large subunit ribosomal protein L25